MFVCLASQAQSQLQAREDVIPRETHEDEMEEMRREVQQCKEFIQAQQQLLQVRHRPHLTSVLGAFEGFWRGNSGWIKEMFV